MSRITHLKFPITSQCYSSISVMMFLFFNVQAPIDQYWSFYRFHMLKNKAANSDRLSASVSLVCECVRDCVLRSTCSTCLLPFPRVCKRTFPSFQCQIIFDKLSQVLLLLLLVFLANFVPLFFQIIYLAQQFKYLLVRTFYLCKN